VLDSKHFLKLHEVYEEPSRIHILEEFDGGTLSDLLLKTCEGKRLTVQEVCTVTYKLVEALGFLHERDIVFRNLKPENIVFTRADDLSSLKICNFEYAINLSSEDVPEPEGEGEYYSLNYTRLVKIERRLKTSDSERKKAVGTCIYMAPEMVLEQNYDEKVDIWSLGVILFLLLTNTHPLQYLKDFVGKSEIKDAIVDILQSPNPESLIDFDNGLLEGISPELEYLLKKMLRINKNERISAAQIMEIQSILTTEYNEYISEKSLQAQNNSAIKRNKNGKLEIDRDASVSCFEELIEMLTNKQVKAIKKNILEVFSKTLVNPEEYDELSTLFNSLDLSENASIDQENIDLFYSVYVEGH